MVKTPIQRWFLLFIGVSLFAASLAKAESGYTAVTNITVIPINVDGSVPHQTVLVRDGRIVTIGPVASVQVPNNARRIDGTGKYLLPGLADMHVHISTSDELPLYIANGVTTVRNMNGRPAHLDWRRRLLAGQMRGPRLYTAGPTTYSADSAAGGEGLVREQKKQG
jgi:hypothetical protein